MKLGDVVLVDFPFTNLVQTKIRPAVVVTITDDHFNDVVLCLISSVLPSQLSRREILIIPSELNNLRVPSVIKAYRVATIQQAKIISTLGRL